MKRIVALVVGTAMGLAIGFTLIATALFFGLGVGVGVLRRRDPARTSILSYDPSSVASKVPYLAFAALVLIVLFALIAVRLGHEKRRSR